MSKKEQIKVKRSIPGVPAKDFGERVDPLINASFDKLVDWASVTITRTHDGGKIRFAVVCEEYKDAPDKVEIPKPKAKGGKK